MYLESHCADCVSDEDEGAEVGLERDPERRGVGVHPVSDYTVPYLQFALQSIGN